MTNASKTEPFSFLDAIEFFRCESAESRVPTGENFFEQYAKNCDEFKILLDENEADMFKATRTPTNLKKVGFTFKALAKFPDFTDEQEEIIQRIINAFNEGDIPAKDTQKINQAVKIEKIRFSSSKEFMTLSTKNICSADNRRKIFRTSKANNSVVQFERQMISMSRKQQIFEDVLQSAYSLEKFAKFSMELFTGLNVFFGRAQKPPQNFYEHIKEFYALGRQNVIAVLAVNLQKNKSVEHARSVQINFVKTLIENEAAVDGTVVAFYSDSVLEK